MEPRRLVNITQAAQRVGVCRRTIFHWIAAGKLQCVKTAGGHTRIYEDSLLRAHPQSKPPDEEMTDMLATHHLTTPGRVIAAVVLLLLVAAPAVAQQPIQELATSVEILVIPATGNPVTLPPVSNGTRATPIGPGTANCNQPTLPPPTLPLINPTTAEVPDPYNAGRFCRAAMPTNMPNGTNLRAVATFSATTCGVGQPCTSERSPVGIPPFDLVGIRVAPAAPTSVGVRP